MVGAISYKHIGAAMHAFNLWSVMRGFSGKVILENPPYIMFQGTAFASFSLAIQCTGANPVGFKLASASLGPGPCVAHSIGWSELRIMTIMMMMIIMMIMMLMILIFKVWVTLNIMLMMTTTMMTLMIWGIWMP